MEFIMFQSVRPRTFVYGTIITHMRRMVRSLLDSLCSVDDWRKKVQGRVSRHFWSLWWILVASGLEMTWWVSRNFMVYDIIHNYHLGKYDVYEY